MGITLIVGLNHQTASGGSITDAIKKQNNNWPLIHDLLRPNE
jgi:hypothetical protein